MNLFLRIVSLFTVLSLFSACSLVHHKQSATAKTFTPNHDFTRTFDTVSPEEEDAIGRAVAAHILSTTSVLQDAALTKYVNEVGATVAAHSARTDTFAGYTFIILNSEDVNAMAAPGGYIFISKGLLKLISNEDQLAAVLAHEVTHVVKRHGLQAIKPDHYANYKSAGKQIISALDCSGLSAQLLAAFSGAINDVLDALLKSGYSREQEFEADRGAAALLLVTGYDPSALAKVLAVLEKLPQHGGWFATHPPATDRLIAVREVVTKDADSKAGLAIRSSRFKKHKGPA